jgi:hypothetical protein
MIVEEIASGEILVQREEILDSHESLPDGITWDGKVTEDQAESVSSCVANRL